MIKWKSVAAILVALAGIPTTLFAQGVGTVEGTTIDASTGQPLSGVQVVLVNTQLGALTGTDGQFQIRSVPAGQYMVRAVRMGYQAEDQAVTVLSGSTATVNISLT